MTPQPPGQGESDRSKAKRPRQRQQIVEDRNRLSQDKRNRSQSTRATEPSAPVHPCVGLQVLGIPQNPHENILGADVQVQAPGNQKTDEPDPVRHNLNRRARGSERRHRHPLAAVAVHNQRKGSVRRNDDRHAEEEGLAKVAGLAHFADDG